MSLQKLAPYRKCIVAAVSAFFAMGAKCSPDGFTGEEIWQVVGATATALVTVYFLPNKETVEKA